MAKGQQKSWAALRQFRVPSSEFRVISLRRQSATREPEHRQQTQFRIPGSGVQAKISQGLTPVHEPRQLAERWGQKDEFNLLPPSFCLPLKRSVHQFRIPPSEFRVPSSNNPEPGTSSANPVPGQNGCCERSRGEHRPIEAVPRGRRIGVTECVGRDRQRRQLLQKLPALGRTQGIAELDGIRRAHVSE